MDIVIGKPYRFTAEEELLSCKCGRTPEIVETYDTLQVVCECGETGERFFGDYYDESFMKLTYGKQAIRDWNWMRLKQL